MKYFWVFYVIGVCLVAAEDELVGLSSDEIDAFVTDGEIAEDDRTMDEIIRDAGTERAASHAAGKSRKINYQMDMILSLEQYAFYYTNVSGFAGGAMKSDYWRWPKAVVPYRLSSAFRGREKNIYSAMKEWQEKTCIRFERAGSPQTKNLGHRDNINIVNGDGCFSYVGWSRGGHEVSIDLNGCLYHSTVLHELGHTIGLHHEQCRTDRDDALVILLNNVERANRFNYDRNERTFPFGMPYDYCSIMQYGPRAFSNNRKLTMLTRNQDYQFSIGSQNYLTYTDERVVNHMYKCNSHCSKDDTCKEPCYQNHKCKCICPTKPCPKMPCTSRETRETCDSIKKTLGNKLKTGDYGNGIPGGSSGGGNNGGGGTGGGTGGGGGGGDKGENCKNHDESCDNRAGKGECDNNSKFMFPNCPKACGFCENCGNKSPRCQEWANRGECTKNLWYMYPNCNEACKLC